MKTVFLFIGLFCLAFLFGFLMEHLGCKSRPVLSVHGPTFEIICN